MKSINIEMIECGFYVTINGRDGYYVQVNDKEEIVNVSHWITPKVEAFKNNQDYVKATGIEADRYFIIIEMVESFIKLKG